MSDETPTMQHHAAMVRTIALREGANEADRYCDEHGIDNCLCPECGYAPWTRQRCMLCGAPVRLAAPKLERAARITITADNTFQFDRSHWDGRSRLPCFGNTIKRAVSLPGWRIFTPDEKAVLMAADGDGPAYAAVLDDIRCRYATAMMEAISPVEGQVFIERARAAFGDTEGHWRKTAALILRERER